MRGSRDLNAHWGHWFFYRAQVLARTLRRIGFQTSRVIGQQGDVEPEATQGVPGLDADDARLHVVLLSEKEVKCSTFPRRPSMPTSSPSPR